MMVSIKNERHGEKIIALSNATEEKIVFWWAVKLPALRRRLDSLTFKIVSYSAILCITCPERDL